MKKTWHSPQLLVLARGKPEENVLQACKLNGTHIAGALAPDSCWQQIGGPAPGTIVQCEVTASS